MQLLYWQCSFSSQCAPLSEILYGSPPPSTICMHLQKSNIIFNIAFNLKVNVTQLKIWKWDLFFYFMTGSLLLKQIMTSDLLLQHQIGLTKKSNNLTSLAPILDSFGHFDIFTKFFRVTSINPPHPPAKVFPFYSMLAVRVSCYVIAKMFSFPIGKRVIHPQFLSGLD